MKSRLATSARSLRLLFALYVCCVALSSVLMGQTGALQPGQVWRAGRPYIVGSFQSVIGGRPIFEIENIGDAIFHGSWGFDVKLEVPGRQPVVSRITTPDLLPVNPVFPQDCYLPPW